MQNKNLPEGWFSEKDIETYRRLISYIPDGSTIVELGSWKGRSICSVADIILKKNIKVYIVDTFEGTENEGDAHIEAKKINLHQEFFNNIKQFNLEDFLTIYCTTTDDAARYFKEHNILFDFVFVDADHSTEAVTKDIQNYSKLLKTKDSLLVGHDLSWESVRKAVSNCITDINDMTHNGENMWWFEPGKVVYNPSCSVYNPHDVTAVICTKDRYDYLYNTILCVANQTKTPEYLTIYDDSDNKINFDNDYKWIALFDLLTSKNIEYLIVNTKGHGQNKNHQDSIKKSVTRYIWRVDDDLIFGNKVLENLWLSIVYNNPGSGAVAPRVFMPNCSLYFNQVSGKINDIFTKMNMQLCIDGNGKHEVEHLHCTFLYDRTIGVNYHSGLSTVGHREETIFSYRIFKAGYKLIVDLDTEVWHLKANSGGIRSTNVTEEMFLHDEKLFKEELESIQYEKLPNQDKTFFGYFNNGIGDHFVFKQLLPQIQEKYDKIILSVCYPEVFWDVKDVELMSLTEGQKIMRKMDKTEQDYSIYHYMDNNKDLFNVDENHLLQAYKQIYL